MLTACALSSSKCREEPEREAAAPLVAVLDVGLGHPTGGAWCPAPGASSGLLPELGTFPQSRTEGEKP